MLQQFNGYIAGDVSIPLFNLQITSTGLTFQYQAATDSSPSQFELFGTLAITLPTGSDGTVITAALGTQQDPGLILKGGSLTHLNIGLDTNKDFSIFGFKVITHQVHVEWQQADNSYLISGAFGADFKIFQGTFQLGDTPQDGLIIKDGAWSLKEAKITLQDIQFGAFKLTLLTVEWNETLEAALPFTITVTGEVITPGGITVDGEPPARQRRSRTTSASPTTTPPASRSATPARS